MITAEQYTTIDTLIRQGRSFALWRIPGNDTIHFRMQSFGQPELLDNLSDLNGRTGFVIAPFHISDRHPIVLLKPDCLELDEDSTELPQAAVDVVAHELPPIRTDEEERLDYRQRFERFSRPLLAGTQDKLVLSRTRTVAKQTPFSAGKAFFRACERYIYSYVYLLHTPQTGTWMGGTPEVILSGEGKAWETVALAGTQLLEEKQLPKQWDRKNWQEQQLVAAYIRRQLGSLGIELTEKGPYSTRAGDLAHLKSNFYFELEDTHSLGDLLELLHPTPAVCGLPKEDAYRFILENEATDRGYYSGFVGWLSPGGRTDLYVNLRCVNIRSDRYTLFAGGGLLASSQLDDEWRETEEKMKTMQNVLV